jgi:sulfate/thiosulfate transport system permease protein
VTSGTSGGNATRLGLRALAVGYLVLMLLVPVAVIVQDGLSDGLGGLWEAVRKPTAWHALKLTLWTSAVMAVINAVMGTLTAYVLVRVPFPAKRLVNAVIDVPLAIPTLVTGVMLVTLYGPQHALGAFLTDRLGFQVIFASPGIILALLFITYPFVVRTVQPVLEELDPAQEEAAATLGAGPIRTFFRVTVPELSFALLSGTILSFARAIGEFGSIVIVAGNIPLKTQTAAVYVWGEVESNNRLGASAVSVVMMAITFSLVLGVDWMQRRRARERPS